MNPSRVIIGLLTIAAILSLILLGHGKLGDEQAHAFVDAEAANKPDFAAGQVATSTAYLPLLRRSGAELPDLVVDDVFNTWCPEDEGQCSCVPERRPGKLMACIENQGPVVAGAFDVTINDTMLRVASLGASQRQCIEDGPEATRINVHVDPQDEVRESREDNNTFTAEHFPLPTPIPTCTPDQ